MSNASQMVKDLTNVSIVNPITMGQSNVASRQRKQTSQAAQDLGLTAPPDEPGVVPTPVTPMPVPGQDDLANIAARRKSIEQQLYRRGRLSTILSNPLSEPLGG